MPQRPRQAAKSRPRNSALVTFARGEYDFPIMGKVDWEKERQRLTVLYAKMENGELNKIAADFDSLNEVAREALRDEMAKRGLQVSSQLATLAAGAQTTIGITGARCSAALPRSS